LINLPICNAYVRGALHYLFTIFLLFLNKGVTAQTLGGSSVFSFLKLSSTPQLIALGGVNVSQPSNDVGLAFSNPARPGSQLPFLTEPYNFFSMISLANL
jgi:hypothetical protein